MVVASALYGVTDDLKKALEKASMGDQEYVNNVIIDLKSRHHKTAKEAITNKVVLDPVLHKIDELVQEFGKVLISISYLREVTPRSQDYILSFGEKLSTAIVCAALQDLDLEAKCFTGGEAGIVTDDGFGEAKPLMYTTSQQLRERIGSLLEGNTVPVITGYIACTQDNVTTTLGRGASDYSATIIGSALDADEVWLWKDVDGLMTADPKITPNAKAIPMISYGEAMEMAYFGAKVLHPEALEPVAEKGIPVSILNVFNPEGLGTRVVKDSIVKNGKVVKSIVMIKDVALITVSGAGMVGVPGVAAKVFSILGENRVNILMISQSSSEANISFVVPRDSLDYAVNTLELTLLGGDVVSDISSEGDVCIVAVVGAGMKGIPGVAAKAFGAVAAEGINIRMIAQGSSELNISFVVSQD
ncbi:MAG: aspartate kinase, partial [Candidatus Bathyarchaeota archaeon]